MRDKSSEEPMSSVLHAYWPKDGIRQEGVAINTSLRDAIAALADARDMGMSTLIQERLMPLIRKNWKILPISYTMMSLKDHKWHAPLVGGTKRNPADALLTFNGTMLVILRGDVYPNNEFFPLRRVGKNTMAKWWGECIKRVGKILDPKYPDRWRIFGRITEEIRNRSMVFYGWTYSGFLPRLLKLPESRIDTMDSSLLAFCQSAGLWFESKCTDEHFMSSLREGLRLLLIAEPSMRSWCGELLLQAAKITDPSTPCSTHSART